MPRRNKTPKHVPFKPTSHSQAKTRYATRADAERAIAHLQRYNLELSLRTYQSPTNGGWYLTKIIEP